MQNEHPIALLVTHDINWYWRKVQAASLPYSVASHCILVVWQAIPDPNRHNGVALSARLPEHVSTQAKYILP